MLSEIRIMFYYVFFVWAGELFSDQVALLFVEDHNFGIDILKPAVLERLLRSQALFGIYAQDFL